MVWLVLLLYNPLPLLVLLGIMNQRKQLRLERVRLATLHRVASGGGKIRG